jgi:hypothetical protein
MHGDVEDTECSECHGHATVDEGPDDSRLVTLLKDVFGVAENPGEWPPRDDDCT